MRALRIARLGYVAALLSAIMGLGAMPAGAACVGTSTAREASAAEIAAFVRGKKLEVLSFVGYSGAGYENPRAMLAQAGEVLARHDPKRTLVNIGATAEGIGAVYELARRKGFATMGIVSSLARDEKVPLSTCVDTVFYVHDSSWGGVLEGGAGLAPTSAAIVGVSTEMVGIGGGAIALAEMLAMRSAGKPVSFHPADMNHAQARAKAAAKGLPAPTDFRGEAQGPMSKPN